MRHHQFCPSQTCSSNAFEKYKLLSYVRNFLAAKSNLKAFTRTIGEWFEDCGFHFISFSLMNAAELKQYEDFSTFFKANKREAEKRIAALYLKIDEKIKRAAPVPSRLENKINLAAKLLKLSDIETEILGFFVRLEFSGEVEALIDEILNKVRNNRNPCFFFLPYSEIQIENALNAAGKLISCGLIETEYNGTLTLARKGGILFSQHFQNIGDLRKIVLGAPLKSELQWQDFKHIEDKNFCAKLLKSALKAHRKGFNILLYGEPGTGKTEFAKVLSQKIGAELYTVGEKFSDTPNRLECLHIICNTLEKEKNVCLLIDEADDLMCEKKIYVNRILENNLNPTIWIVNSIRYWDKAYLRRFSYAIHFKKPDLAGRKEIWKKVLKKHNIQISSQKAAELASKYNLSPSFISTAILSAKTAKGDIEDICKSLDAMQKAYNNGIEEDNAPKKQKEEKKPLNFNVSLLNTDTDLGKLAVQIKNLKKTKFSLCLYGVSGTGKSAYAEYLADRLGMPVIKKRCSDLLSMWHGETEQNIARAFKEAKNKRALLVFDEADSFLYNRQNSTHAWEVAEVNEMLTQMEKHDLPFVCTTNLMDNLDKASLRRFTFKVEYKYMLPEQNSLAFEHFFDFKAVDLSYMSTLTPADFVVVKEKAEIMDCLQDKDELIKMLENEQKQKAPAPTVRRIGFL